MAPDGAADERAACATEEEAFLRPGGVRPSSVMPAGPEAGRPTGWRGSRPGRRGWRRGCRHPWPGEQRDNAVPAGGLAPGGGQSLAVVHTADLAVDLGGAGVDGVDIGAANPGRERRDLRGRQATGPTFVMNRPGAPSRGTRVHTTPDAFATSTAATRVTATSSGRSSISSGSRIRAPRSTSTRGWPCASCGTARSPSRWRSIPRHHRLPRAKRCASSATCSRRDSCCHLLLPEDQQGRFRFRRPAFDLGGAEGI
jgi:hypothetical protein